MLQIGEFAAVTGLSVKALRHYDREDVLSPAVIDTTTGYRYYVPEQVRIGVIVRTLRAAGVPLAGVDRALASGSSARALAMHRDDLLQARQREDLALSAAELTLKALDTDIAVLERRMPAQSFVGHVLPRPKPGDGFEAFDTAASKSTVLLRLLDDGVEVDGRTWTTSTARGSEATEFLFCWATSVALPPQWAGPGEVVGVLPEGTDLVARRQIDHADETSDSLHPQVVALFDALAARGAAVDGIQIRHSVHSYGPDTYTVEVATRLR